MQLGCYGILLLLSTAVKAGVCPAEMRMPYNSTWLPYVEVQDETVTGSDIELIRKALTAVGTELKLLPLPESRALNQLEHGQVDILFAASYTKERALYAWFSAPYRQEINQLVVHQQLLQKYPELNSKQGFLTLASRRLAGTYNPKGFYGEEFEVLKQLPAVIQRSVAIFDPEQRLDLVLSQRADYSIVDQDWLLLRNQQYGKEAMLEVLPFILHQADIHLMLSKKNVSAACVDALNIQLQQKEKQRPGAATRS